MIMPLGAGVHWTLMPYTQKPVYIPPVESALFLMPSVESVLGEERRKRRTETRRQTFLEDSDLSQCTD